MPGDRSGLESSQRDEVAIARTETELRGRLGRAEFVAILSLMMALSALSIDVVLPAFGDIRAEYGLAPDSTEAAGVVTAFLLGFALAQVVYGPFADRFGRRPVLYTGFAVFAVGAVAAALAPSLELVLVARFVWGLGAAAPRVVVISMVRDVYEGDRMARAMSFVMAVFILVPILAPSLGAVLVAVGPWRWVFWFCVLYVAAIGLWARRLPETLDPRNRIQLRFDGIARAARIVFTSRLTMGYMAAMTLLFGVFVSYLASSELIWSDVYGRGDQFPFIFGGIAAVMGGAMLTNAAVVGRFGTVRMVHVVLVAYVGLGTALVVVALATGGAPPFWVFLPMLAATLATHALLIPNFNTVAMGPVGAVAGTASAVIGTVSTGVAALIGSVIDRAFDGTVRPMAFGFLAAGVLAIAVVAWTEKGRMFPGPPQPAVPPTTIPG